MENSNKKVYNLVKRNFKQYLEVVKFVSNLKGKIILIDIGSQDSKLKNLLPSNITYKSLDMGEGADYKCDLNKTKIPVKDKSFDITVCLETLEHVFYPDNVMQELKRITKDSGFLIISMPNEYNFWLRIHYLLGIKKEQTDEPFEIVSKLQHIHKPRVKDICQLLNKHLRIIKIIPIWQSRKSYGNDFFYLIDNILNLFSKIYPSLFSRLVVVIGKKKENL